MPSEMARNYFVRHTKGLRVIDEAIDYLWENNKIAIHYPERKRYAEDLTSLDPSEYESREARVSIIVFRELNDRGGYIWAQYRNTSRSSHHEHVRVKIGKIVPGSFSIYITKWRDIPREAKLKTLKIEKAIEVQPGDEKGLRRIRPRKGTIFRWPSAGQRLAHLIEAR